MGGKRLVGGSSQTAMQALELRQQKMDWRHLQTGRLSLSLIVGAALSAAAAHPLAELEGQSPLNLNIRSLRFEALGCSVLGAHLKGKRGSVSPAPIVESHLTKNLFLPRSPESKCTQTDCCTGAASLVCRKNKEMVEEERAREMDGGRGSKGEGEKSQKPPRNNAREKSEHFPPKDGPFPNPCALSDKLK